MVHAATTHQTDTRATAKKRLALKAHQATSAKHHAGLGFNGASLKARISKIQVSSKPEILVDRIHQTHFTELVSLADKVGMTDTVNALLACEEKTDLSPFINALVETIKQTVRSEVDTRIETNFESLYQTLTSNGITLDKEAFMALAQATRNENYGTMQVSIRAMDNTDFDTVDKKMRLSIFSTEKDLTFIQPPTCNLSRSALKVLKEHDSQALLLTATDALCAQSFELYGIYESLTQFEDHELNQCPKALLEKMLEKDDEDFFPWLTDETMSDEDKEQEIEILLPKVKAVIAARQKENAPSSPTFLSEWFASKIHRIDDDAIKLLAHSNPIHVVTDNECIGDIVSRDMLTGDHDENGESFLQLNPEKAIETLVGITINRQLFNLYDMLHFVGREDDLRESLIKTLTGKRNANTVFKRG